jgi:hypothetical protein
LHIPSKNSGSSSSPTRTSTPRLVTSHLQLFQSRSCQNIFQEILKPPTTGQCAKHGTVRSSSVMQWCPPMWYGMGHGRP